MREEVYKKLLAVGTAAVKVVILTRLTSADTGMSRSVRPGGFFNQDDDDGCAVGCLLLLAVVVLLSLAAAVSLTALLRFSPGRRNPSSL